MGIRKGIVFIVALGMAGLVPAQAAGPTETPPEVLETLLDRDAPADARDAAMRQLVAHAQAGDGHSAFYLGALYRHGMDHPARRVERDVETARFWLERCVESARCPLIALASLAELELAAGNAKPAMQWAQAWVILERELDRRDREDDPNRQTRDAAYRYTSYQAYLIGRCYKAMPNARDPGALGRGWFDELRTAKGSQLDRMLFAALEGEAGDRGPRLRISAENQRTKVVDPRAMQPFGPALGFYLYRGNPAGGRAETVRLIEALPTPAGARGLDALVRSIKTSPYALEAAGQRLYAQIPVSFNDGHHSLVPVK